VPGGARTILVIVRSVADRAAAIQCKDLRSHGKLLVGSFKAGCYRYFH
jgi:hypothetical protein